MIHCYSVIKFTFSTLATASLALSLDATHFYVGRYASRLTHIKENHKFQKNGVAGFWPEDHSLGLQHTVLDAKANFNLK